MNATQTSEALWTLVNRLAIDRTMLAQAKRKTKGKAKLDPTHKELLHHLGAAELAARRMLVEANDGGPALRSRAPRPPQAKRAKSVKSVRKRKPQ